MGGMKRHFAKYPKNKVSVNIRAIRLENNLTAKDLAELCGGKIHPSTILGLEDGRSHGTEGSLTLIAQALGVTYEELTKERLAVLEDGNYRLLSKEEREKTRTEESYVPALARKVSSKPLRLELPPKPATSPGLEVALTMYRGLTDTDRTEFIKRVLNP
jgi:transcriptional regulator with XRE-family HTH domain